MRSTLSVMGLYDYDNTIFDNMQIPEGLDKDVLVKNILVETAELEVLYPNPEVFKQVVGWWSQKEMLTWDKQWKAMQIEYNPLENYDRVEEWHDAGTEKQTGKATGKDKRVASGWQTEVTGSEAINQVSGFNSEDWANSEKNNADGTTTTSGFDEIDDETKTDTQSNSESANHRAGRAHGNLGVTTSQQMLREELDIARENMYNIIIGSFRNRFCLLIY